MKIKLTIFIFLFISFAHTAIWANSDSLNVNYTNNSETKLLKSFLKKTWKLRANNPRLALSYGTKAIAIAKKKHLTADLAKAYNYIGVIYRNISEYDSSFIFYNKALRTATEINDSVQIAYAYNNIGGYYGYKQYFFLALKNIFIARKIFKRINNLSGLAFADVQAGLWFSILNLNKKAEKYLIEAFQIRRKLNYKFGITIVRALLADLYYKMGMYEKAGRFYRLLVDEFKEYNDVKGMGTAFGGMGGVAYHQLRYSEALNYRLQALKYLNKVSYKLGLIFNYNGLGLIYNALQQPKKAIEYEKLAIDLSLKINDKPGLATAYKNLMLIYKDLDNTKVYEYALKYSDIKDEIVHNDLNIRVEELNSLISSNELSEQNLELQRQLKLSRVIIYAGVAGGAIFLLLLILISIEFKKRRDKEEQLREALAEKNKLFSIVAHDLKNPFSSLLGFTDMILSDFNSFEKEDLRDVLANIRGSSLKLLGMVENILTWARAQTGKIKVKRAKYNLNSLLLETTSFFTQTADSKNISIKVQFEGKPVCFIDKDLFSTAVRNLISNSLKFTNPGGEIIISTRLNKEEGVALVIISDTGVGMTDEQLEHIWDVNKESGVGTSGEKGTSLGLILVKEAVKANGGTISVESQVGLGTEFVFTVPLYKENPDPKKN